MWSEQSSRKREKFLLNFLTLAIMKVYTNRVRSIESFPLFLKIIPFWADFKYFQNLFQKVYCWWQVCISANVLKTFQMFKKLFKCFENFSNVLNVSVNKVQGASGQETTMDADADLSGAPETFLQNKMKRFEKWDLWFAPTYL